MTTGHPVTEASDVLRERFRRHPVATLPELCRVLSASGRTVFRVLARIGYHSSYDHAGRYYTIDGIPRFDEHGLWLHEDIGFSSRGTLRATIEALVAESATGYTQEELGRLLRLRVHDPLRSLVEAKRLGRERVEALYVYVSAHARTARQQLARRRGPLATATPPPLDTARVIDVQVAELFRKYDLQKKTARSRSRPSPH